MAARERSIRVRSADGRFGMFLPNHVVEELLRICGEAVNVETGGILIGRYTEDRTVAVVDQVTGPPPDSKRFFARFLRGIVGLQNLLNHCWSEAAKRYYLGEWHYHPLPDPVPSNEDRAQMRKIAASDQYACSEPVLLIVAGPLSAGWKFTATVHSRDGLVVSMAEASTGD